METWEIRNYFVQSPMFILCNHFFSVSDSRNTLDARNGQEEDAIENKMDQHRLPFDDSSGNGASAEQPCNIVVHKMQDEQGSR